MEREKVDFKSREVNCLKECALALRKINEISPTRSTWAIAVVTVFDAYDYLIKTMNDRINASQAVIKALSKHYEFESPNHRFYNLFESLKIEPDIIFPIQKHIHEKQRSLLPFVGSALSYFIRVCLSGLADFIKYSNVDFRMSKALGRNSLNSDGNLHLNKRNCVTQW